MGDRKHSSVEEIPSFKEDFPSLPIDSSILNTLIEDAQDWAHVSDLSLPSPSSLLHSLSHSGEWSRNAIIRE